MSTRYSVFNPQGEEFETPSEARSAQLRQALMLDQMRGGGGNVQRAGSNGGGVDGFFQDAPAGPTFQDQLEAKKTMLREGVAGEMALGGQHGQQAMDLAGLQDHGATERTKIVDTGETTRAGINIAPANTRAGIERDTFNVNRPGMEADVGLRVSQDKLGTLRNGIQGDILGGLGGGQGIINAIPEAQRGEFASRAAGSLFGFDPTEEARGNRRAMFQQGIEMARFVAQSNPALAGAAIAAAQKGDFEGLSKLSQNAAQLSMDPAVTSKVQMMKNIIADNNVYLTDADMEKIDNLYQSVSQDMQSRGVPPMVIEQVFAPIRQALVSKAKEVSKYHFSDTGDRIEQRYGG